MTKSVYRNIRAALETYLSNSTGLPSISYENTRTTPSTGTEFITTKFVPTLREPAVRGTDPQHRYQGIFRLEVHYNYQDGTGLLEEVVDEIVDRFNSTTDIIYSPSVDSLLKSDGDVLLLESGDEFLLDDEVTVRIRKTQRRGSYTVEPWYITPVEVDWYVYK